MVVRGRRDAKFCVSTLFSLTLETQNFASLLKRNCMPSQRRLAAIMFSDIAGYTAMMQRNESDGMIRVKRYRQVLSDNVAAHGGQLLQHYGDGSLCIFDSAVEAVACAAAIQLELQQPPEVPLRIGIHLGDIVVEGEDIFGDGVNLTSRVQSLAVPGAVLLTERVLPDVRSHPKFRTVSLGKFTFKNVSEPIEVFALATEDLPVPTRREIRRRLLAATATDYGATSLTKGRLAGAAALATLAVLTVFLILHFVGSGNDGPVAGQTGISPPLPPTPPPALSGAIGRDASIAVLPFEDMSPARDQAYFGDGIAEEILNVLAQIEGLKVAGRTSSFAYRGRKVDLRQIGEELGVGAVLEGSIRKSGNQVRITAQLINTQDGYHLWSETYDRELTDIFAVQDTIARSVVENLKGILLPHDVAAPPAMAATKNEAAYEWYLRGKYLLSQRSDGAQRAEEFFRKAVELDPQFAQAQAGLAHALLWQAWGNFRPSSEAFPEARRYVEEALQHNDRLAYAHALLGSIDLWYDWNWNAARQSLEKALAINPKEAAAYLDLGWYYTVAGQPDEALRQGNRAVALDPLNLEYNIDLADMNRLARRYDDARRLALAMEEVYPDNSETHWMMGMIAYHEADYQQAVTDFREAVRLSDGDVWSLLHLTMALAQAGQTDEARSTLKRAQKNPRLEELAPVELAMAYLALGNRSQALQLLEKAYAMHANWLISLRADPVWDDLRGDARFKSLIQRMKFPD